MAASLLGLYRYSGGSGRCRRVHARSGDCQSAAAVKKLLSRYARRGGRRSAAALKQLLSRLRRSWRRRAAARPRRSAVRFGYDLHSYYQNFDDGIASSGHRRL